MLINQMEESFHNVHIYQITTVSTFSILQFYISIINILKKNYLRHSGHFYIVQVREILSSPQNLLYFYYLLTVCQLICLHVSYVIDVYEDVNIFEQIKIKYLKIILIYLGLLNVSVLVFVYWFYILTKYTKEVDSKCSTKNVH